jgi:hypothetical protein
MCLQDTTYSYIGKRVWFYFESYADAVVKAPPTCRAVLSPRLNELRAGQLWLLVNVNRQIGLVLELSSSVITIHTGVTASR